MRPLPLLLLLTACGVSPGFAVRKTCTVSGFTLQLQAETPCAAYQSAVDQSWALLESHGWVDAKSKFTPTIIYISESRTVTQCPDGAFMAGCHWEGGILTTVDAQSLSHEWLHTQEGLHEIDNPSHTGWDERGWMEATQRLGYSLIEDWK